GWLDRLQEQARHGSIDAIAADELTGVPALFVVPLVAFVAGRAAVAGVAHAHAPAALAAQHQALQQGLPLAHGPAAVVLSDGAVVVQALLIAEELLPGDVT